MLHRVIMLLILVSAVCSTSSGVLAGEFDFKKTTAFMREMESRPDFPVSTVLAHDYAYSLNALNGKIDAKKNKAIQSLVKGLQQIDGGFVSDKHDKSSSIIFTDQALDTVSLLKGGAGIDTGRAKTFVASLMNADGGFGFSAEAKQSGLVNTYYAVHSLSALKGLRLVDAAKTAAYIKGFEHKEGGFSYVKGTGTPSAKITYMAVYVLKELGKLDEATKASALKYLNATAYGKGTAGKVDSLQMLEEMAYTVEALKLLGAKEKIDTKKANGILKQLYIKQNGGFGPIPGYGSSPDSTTLGIRILVGIGTLKAPVVYPVVK